MPKLKKHFYSPNTVMLDMRNQPDAEIMLKIAKSIKGSKIEVTKNSPFVTIHYPQIKGRFHLLIKLKSSKNIWEIIEPNDKGKHPLDNHEEEPNTRLYHAMILK